MFGCIVAGRLVQTNLQQVDVNKWVFELSDANNINHITVFLLGTIPFDPGYGATVHILWPGKDWKLLGCLTNEKPSCIFRVKNVANSGKTNNPQPADQQPMVTATLGISIEPLNVIQSQLATLPPGGDTNQSSALIKPGVSNLSDAGFIASRILEHLYNYVTSFATNNLPMGAIPLAAVADNGYLPMKAFQTWYENLGKKITNNPNYLLKGDVM
ncbi:hypothetical protein BGW37DRAFT_556928 [Umbelopsis sp. PMI_123]|nr:hypothetical protein BGW37DRAFT_556928 [Umbelopsis sp. PMI_123]